MYFRAVKLFQHSCKQFSYPTKKTIMCDKEVVKLRGSPQSFTTGMPKVLLQRAEEIFPALKENMVSVLCMIGIVLSCSVMIVFAGVFDVVVPRQN
jgi:hypothetical protein